MYGTDLRSLVSVVHDVAADVVAKSEGTDVWAWSRALRELVLTPLDRAAQMDDQIAAFTFAIPKARSCFLFTRSDSGLRSSSHG